MPLIALLLIGFFAAGCGQKGPLYLPDEDVRIEVTEGETEDPEAQTPPVTEAGETGPETAPDAPGSGPGADETGEDE
jgi:predicted small lipoprotein YifL